MILVHVDAHLDYVPPPALPLKQAFMKGANISEITGAVERALAYQRLRIHRRHRINEGNFLYYACQEKIFKHLVWVVPGDIKSFIRSGNFFIRMLEDFSSREVLQNFHITFSRYGLISSHLGTAALSICTLQTIPLLKGPVLLDIDVDFLLARDLTQAHKDCAEKCAIPWLSPGSLVERLKNKLPPPSIITVARSIEDGWVPARFRAIGDRIAAHFNKN